MRKLPENLGVPDKDVKAMAKHFEIMLDGAVFRFIDEE